MQTHAASFFPVPALTAMLGTKWWAVDFFNLLAENPSDWEKMMFGVHIKNSPTAESRGRVGSQKSTSPLLLDDGDPNPKVDHKGVGAASDRATGMEGMTCRA